MLLRDLFDAIEPIKWYARLLGEAALRARVAGSTAAVERPYSVTTPLNRVVDYIDPASEWVVQFDTAVRALIDGSADAEDIALVARRRDSLAPSARNRTGGGCQQCPQLRNWTRFRNGWRSLRDVVDAALKDEITDAHRAILDVAKAPIGELIIAVVPVLEEWLGE